MLERVIRSSSEGLVITRALLMCVAICVSSGASVHLVFAHCALLFLVLRSLCAGA